MAEKSLTEAILYYAHQAEDWLKLHKHYKKRRCLMTTRQMPQYLNNPSICPHQGELLKKQREADIITDTSNNPEVGIDLLIWRTDAKKSMIQSIAISQTLSQGTIPPETLETTSLLIMMTGRIIGQKNQSATAVEKSDII